MTEEGRLGGATVRQVEGKKCSGKSMVSEQGRGKESNLHIGEIREILGNQQAERWERPKQSRTG